MAAAGTCDPCLRGHLAHGRNQSLAGPRAPASRPSRRLCVARVGAMVSRATTSRTAHISRPATGAELIALRPIPQDASPSAPEAAWSTTPVRRGVLSLPPLPKSGNASQDLAVLMVSSSQPLVRDHALRLRRDGRDERRGRPRRPPSPTSSRPRTRSYSTWSRSCRGPPTW